MTPRYDPAEPRLTTGLFVLPPGAAAANAAAPSKTENNMMKVRKTQQIANEIDVSFNQADLYTAGQVFETLIISPRLPEAFIHQDYRGHWMGRFWRRRGSLGGPLEKCLPDTRSNGVSSACGGRQFARGSPGLEGEFNSNLG